MATKKKAAPATEAPAAAPEIKITSYKGFDKDWKCRDFQYEIGKTYEHQGAAVACSSGFHACEYPLHVLRYYPANQNTKFAVVEQTGSISRHDEDTKVASSRITVKAEISLTELIKASIKYTWDRCTPVAGGSTGKPNEAVQAIEKNHAATASGNSGAATASGYYGAATASGYSGKARGKNGCAIFLVYRDSDKKIIHAKGAIVGIDGIKEDVFYRLDKDGNFVEVQL